MQKAVFNGSEVLLYKPHPPSLFCVSIINFEARIIESKYFLPLSSKRHLTETYVP